MKRIPKELRFPKLRMQATFEPKTVDADARTVEVRWYTGATVQRFSFEDGPYLLTMSMDPKAVRMGRLNSGSAPFKAGHSSSNDLSAVLGVIEKAWLDKDGGRALVRFSSRAEVEPYFQDVREGILRNVSMEAAIHKADEITKKGDAEPHLLATDWEPTAVALVAVGADPSAQALSDTSETFPCQITFSASEGSEAPKRARAPKENRMKIKVKLLASNETVEIEELDFDETLHEELDEQSDEEAALEAARARRKAAKAAKLAAGNDPRAVRNAVTDEIERAKAIAVEVHRLAEEFGLDELWAERHIKLGTPIDQVIKLAAKRRAELAPAGVNSIGVDRDSIHYRSEQMATAIASRASGTAVPESARAYASMGFVDVAYETLKATRQDFGIDPRNRSRVIEMALTTSDFPNLLANASNKVLLPAYDAAMPTYRMLCMRQDLPDFKSASVLNTGDFPAPLQVAEAGEIKLGYFAEQKNTVALGTYGRRLSFSRQSLINDDLNSFGRVMGAYGVRIADFENAAFFTLLSTVGPTLGDTGAMFNATAVTTAGGHANYTSSGTAISDTSITVGYALMAAQTGIGTTGLGDGVKLNIQPKYLLAAPGKRNLAYQYTSSAYVPSAPTSMNSWAGQLTPILDANLSGNRWWLFADPAAFPNFAFGSLAGAAGPRVQTRAGFEIEGVELRVAFDFYVGGIDFRGGYCNAGA